MQSGKKKSWDAKGNMSRILTLKCGSGVVLGKMHDSLNLNIPCEPKIPVSAFWDFFAMIIDVEISIDK